MELFAGAFGTTAVDVATDDRAVLDALCEVESALARACAQVGLIDLPTAMEIGLACDVVRGGDPAELGRLGAAGGNPVIPLVEQLRAAVRDRAGERAAHAVHLGATSQDILDTALMLVASRASGVVLAALGDAANSAAALARAHRDTPMAARTLLQPAVASSFGALAATWGQALDHSRTRLGGTALPASLGGAGGTLAGWHPHGFAVLAAFAEELDLAEPTGVWHADRSPVHDLAAALATVAAAIAKVAGDVVLLAQGEIGEVREAAPGGSSAMAHKRNPIAAITARAGALRAPGLAVGLLAAAPELQRGAGAWHAEWVPLLDLLRAVGGASSRLRTCLQSLAIDAAAMTHNLARLADDVDVADLGHAVDLVDRYLERRVP